MSFLPSAVLDTWEDQYDGRLELATFGDPMILTSSLTRSM